MEIIIIIGLALLNGIFSMSEMSLVSSRRFKLENLRKKGNKGAEKALQLSDNPTRFLSTVQIGITLIGILLGVYSGENLTNDIASQIMHIQILQPYANTLATGIVVVFVTYLSIVLGELLPKRIGMVFPESIITFLARPMNMLSVITSPFVWLLTATNDLLLNIMGIGKQKGSGITEDEIKSMVKESNEVQEIEQNIVERVFELGDTKVRNLYTHRSDIVFFTVTESYAQIKSKINNERHSAYPVSKSGNIDDLLGVVLLKDLFLYSESDTFDIRNFIRKPVYINENALAYKVLEIFKKEKFHYGLVVDEFGSVSGMITMDDVVDALVGDVSESYHDEYKVIKRDESSWFMDGQYSIIEFKKFFNIDIEDEITSKFSTVAGIFIYKTNSLPEVGTKIKLGTYELEIIDKDAQRIDKILVTKISEK